MAGFRITPASKGFPLQVVEIAEQFPVVQEILLEFFHHFLAGVVAGYTKGVLPLGCRKKLRPPADVDIV